MSQQDRQDHGREDSGSSGGSGNSGPPGRDLISIGGGTPVEPSKMCLLARPLRPDDLPAIFRDVLAAGHGSEHAGWYISSCVAFCVACGVPVRVDPESHDLLSRGTVVLCVRCGVLIYPYLIVGHDPDTGREITLAELARSPNLVGGFRLGDVKEVAP